MVNRSQFYELRSLDRYLLEALAAVGGGDISMFEGISELDYTSFIVFREASKLDPLSLEVISKLDPSPIKAIMHLTPSSIEGINSIEPADFVAITKLDYSQIKKIWEMSNRDVLAASWKEPHLEGVSMMKIYGIWNIGRSLLEELSHRHSPKYTYVPCHVSWGGKQNGHRPQLPSSYLLSFMPRLSSDNTLSSFSFLAFF